MTTTAALKSDQVNILLVDDKDQVKGFCEKMWVHQIGVLHRAVSVFLTCQESGRILLQRRSPLKYHSPGLWSNAACTHPLGGESPEEAARRALKTELGLVVGPLQYHGHFIYKTNVGNELIEHELDHVFTGELNQSKALNPSYEEVDLVRWISAEELNHELKNAPGNFTHWFPYLVHYLENPKPGKDYRENKYPS